MTGTRKPVAAKPRPSALHYCFDSASLDFKQVDQEKK